jgi:hypothetical protein
VCLTVCILVSLATVVNYNAKLCIGLSAYVPLAQGFFVVVVVQVCLDVVQVVFVLCLLYLYMVEQYMRAQSILLCIRKFTYTYCIRV